MKQNALAMKTKLELMKRKTLDMFNNFVSAEDVLGQPETAYAVGKAIEMYDEIVKLCVDQAEQLDELSEMLKESYDMIRELNGKIDNLQETILRKEIAREAR